MKQRLYALGFIAIAALAACGGGGSGGGASFNPGGGTAGGPAAPPGVTPMTIGFAIPTGSIGTVTTAPFGTVGGYTQSVYSQVLAFPPGTVLTLKNVSTSTVHTLNVLSTTAFPATPASLSFTASGGKTLGPGFASGNVPAGGTMQVTLGAAGTYYIGCAYHYNDAVSMRDVILVSANATPGPQATPQPAASGAPGTGGGGYCPGGYC